MTESVLEALDNKALGMREAKTTGTRPRGDGSPRPLRGDGAGLRRGALREGRIATGRSRQPRMTGKEVAGTRAPPPAPGKETGSWTTSARPGPGGRLAGVPRLRPGRGAARPGLPAPDRPGRGRGPPAGLVRPAPGPAGALAAARAAETALLARAVSGARGPGRAAAPAAALLPITALPRAEQLPLKQRILQAAARGEKIYP